MLHRVMLESRIEASGVEGEFVIPKARVYRRQRFVARSQGAMDAECFVKNKMLYKHQELTMSVIINTITAAQLS